MTYALWVYLIAQAIALAVAGLGYWRKSVDLSGFISMLVISAGFIWLDYLSWLVVLFSMYASSSLLTKFGKKEKFLMAKVVEHAGARNWIQALANLGVAVVCMLLFEWKTHEAFIVAFAASVASANGDSWASEIGGLSKATPRLITTLQPVPKGISGGVTLLGLWAGVMGSAFVSLIAWLVFTYMDGMALSITPFFISVIAFGSFGVVLDSLFGVWFQRVYANSIGQLSEAKVGKEPLKGFSWLNNDGVNFLMTFIVALLAGIMWWLSSLENM